MATVSHRDESETGFIGALRRLRDPLLLVVFPITFALLQHRSLGYLNSWPIGFDFRGTLWEPARALLDGDADLSGADARQHRVRRRVVIGSGCCSVSSDLS